MALNITFWPSDNGDAVVYSNDPIKDKAGEAVDFLSYVNEETYGKPPVITAGSGEREAVARPGDSVLFVNLKNIAAIHVKKLS